MGVAQTFGGVSRVAAPLAATFVFGHFGHVAPFYLAGAVVGLVGILAFRVDPYVPAATPAAGTPTTGLPRDTRGAPRAARAPCATLEALVRAGLRPAEPRPAPPRPRRRGPASRHPHRRPLAGARAPAARREIGAMIDTEKWVGERGLLAVGVVALILAAATSSSCPSTVAGSRRWRAASAAAWPVQPSARSAGVSSRATAPTARRWSAAVPRSSTSRYGPRSGSISSCLPHPGIAVLAIVSLALALIAYTLNVEALGATAAVGAFFAPIFLSPGRGNANLLLIYLAVMARDAGRWWPLGDTGGWRRW